MRTNEMGPLFLLILCIVVGGPGNDLDYNKTTEHRGDIPINTQSEQRSDPEGQNADALNAALRIKPRAVCDCGTQQFVPHRIFGGTEAFPNAYPWMAALVVPPGTVLCGASLISERFALTAAHCFRQPVWPIYVLLGIHDLRAATPNGIAVPVIRVICHPMFNSTSGEVDLAIVEFTYPVFFGPNISPICLPFPTVDYSWQSAIVMGWGLTEFAPVSPTLQEVTLTVIPNEVCQQQYGERFVSPTTMLCAWGYGGKDACKGDSGGPLTWNFEGRWYIIGVVSFGMRCGTSTSAGVYARVDPFLEWILSTTNNGACLAPADVLTTKPYPWLISLGTSAASSGSTGSVPQTPTTGVIRNELRRLHRGFH